VTRLKVAMRWESAFKFFDEYPVENHWSKQLIQDVVVVERFAAVANVRRSGET
jgi:hypothetical protein